MMASEWPVAPALARVHGGPSYDLMAQWGLKSAQDILDFSVNINPYGPAPAVTRAIRTAPFVTYPDPQGGRLKHGISESTGVPHDQVVVGNGAADLLWTLARTLLGPGRRALIAEPTFCEFRAAALATGASVTEHRAEEAQQFRWNLDHLSDHMAATSPAVVYLCNPNSPTGQYVSLREIQDLATRHQNTVLILDEAFLSLSVHHQDARVPLPSNVVRLRSLTKEHAIAGLRVGYLLTTAALTTSLPESQSVPLATALEAQRPSWSLNTIAEAAALAALGEDEYVAQSRDRILADRDHMIEALRSLGLFVSPSSTLYFLARGPREIDWHGLLLRQGILVRDAASYGLPGWIRLCSRPAPDVARLVDAIKHILESKR